ncbi:MAG TPA: hypothetical protein VK638_07545 [Edaphobacter sp.]|nr:hypothetical protein [Edaphobacter sp.]
MEVVVTGWRSSNQDWSRAQQWPLQDLPPLTAEQKTVAHKLGISEEDYARSAYAGELSRQELIEKAERFGRLIESQIREIRANSSVEEVVLKTFDGKFQVLALVDGHKVRLEMDEDMVDDLLRSGSGELETRLKRIIDFNLPVSGSARAS